MNKFFYIAAFTLLAFPVQAQYINITADKQVEWDSQAQKMTAIGNAVAKKDNMEINANKMTAYYAKNDSPNAKNKTTIHEVHAEGNVIATTNGAKAYGDTMDYEVATDSVILKGNPAKIKTEQEVITAQDSITYYLSQNKAIALGNVYAEDKEKNKIYCDKMVAFFKTADASQNNKTEIEKVEIYDHVKIVSKDATVTADKGIYLPEKGVIKLYDNVLIDQQGNKIRGDFAETNLKTGVSRLIAGKSSQGRVSGVFKEQKKDNK